MIDRPLLLVCTDQGTHPEWELVDLRAIEPRRDRPDLPQESPAIRRGFAAQETMSVSTAGGMRPIRKTEVRIVNGSEGEVVHVPRCPTCGRSPRLRMGKLLLAASALRASEDASRDVLDVSLLPGSIGN